MPEIVESTPIKNPVLVEAMRIMQAVPTDDNRNFFLDELIEAKFLSPAKITTGDDGRSNIQFIMLSSPEYPFLLPAFTDWDEVRKWSHIPDQQTVITQIGDLISMVTLKDSTLSGVVINPFGENIIMDKELLQALNRHLSGKNDKEDK